MRFGWERYADDVVSIDRFGASAPGDVVMRELGITPEHTVERALALLDADRIAEELTMASAIPQLVEFGQSPWYDNLTRALATGGLQKLIDDARHPRRHVEPDDLREGDGDGQRLRRAAARGDATAAPRPTTRTGIWSRPTSRTRPTCCARSTTASDGADGFVSVEVSPDLAHDTAATIAQAKELWERLARPNVMIKIPATARGPPRDHATTLAAGINVNVTLIFSLERYQQVIDAFLAGLEQRAAAGGDISRTWRRSRRSS